MGFPVAYTDLFLPKLLLQALTFLSFLRKLITILLNFLGLGDFLEPEISIQQEPISENHSIGAILIREMLPVVKVSTLIDPPDSCAVCLYEFDSNDDVRTLMNCRHIFHRCCVDRWLFHDQKTCPLCRAPFISEDMQETFNERLWVASGISEFYGDYSAITPGL